MKIEVNTSSSKTGTSEDSGIGEDSGSMLLRSGGIHELGFYENPENGKGEDSSIAVEQRPQNPRVPISASTPNSPANGHQQPHHQQHFEQYGYYYDMPLESFVC